MIGMKARLFAPVNAISLDELVPADHFYRHLERVLDLSFVRDLVQDRYAAGGRPSVDPRVFFKLQLVMFFEDVRSERLLMRLVADRLSVRWFLGYNLDEPLPDHSSLTRIRARYGLDVFRRFFEVVVEQCQQAGLVWGRELYFDATHVLANAALDSLVPRFAVEARTAIHAHLDALFAEEPTQHEDQPTPDTPDASSREHTDAAASPPVALPTAGLPIPLPVVLSEPEREAHIEANAARHDWIAAEGQPQREVRGRYNYYQRTADFRISTTDPRRDTLVPQRRWDAPGLPNALRCGWRQATDHLGRVGGTWRGDGEPTDARPGLARPLSLPPGAPPGHRGHDLWHPREHHRAGARRYPCLRAPARLGAQNRLLWPPALHL
jgi:transposase